MLRLRQFPPGLRQDERASAESRFGLAGLKAGLADSRRLLIARHARDLDWPAEQFGQGRSNVACAIDNLRQDSARHIEQAEQSVIPTAATNRHQRGA